MDRKAYRRRDLLVDTDCVQSGIHDVDPAVLRRQHEQRHQSLHAHIIHRHTDTHRHMGTRHTILSSRKPDCIV